jgi:hypothetical protein
MARAMTLSLELAVGSDLTPYARSGVAEHASSRQLPAPVQAYGPPSSPAI